MDDMLGDAARAALQRDAEGKIDEATEEARSVREDLARAMSRLDERTEAARRLVRGMVGLSADTGRAVAAAAEREALMAAREYMALVAAIMDAYAVQPEPLTREGQD